MEEKEVETNRLSYLVYFKNLLQRIKSKIKGKIEKKTRPIQEKITKTPDALKDFFFEKNLKLPSEITVTAEGISKNFGSTKVLKDISFKVPPREIFGIIGLSGSGKTTLLNILVGFLQADKGNIMLEFSQKKETVTDESKYAKRLFGFSTQSPSFYGKLTVIENLMHFAALYNIAFNKRQKRCTELTTAVGLSEHQNTLGQNLSLGMQKRLDIACALIHNPKVLVMDEPTADLDPFTQMQIWNLIKKINSEGTTIILTSHSLTEVEFLCSRTLILGKKTTVINLKETEEENYSLEMVLSEKFEGKIPKTKKYSSLTQKDNLLIFTTKTPDKLIKFLQKFMNKKKIEIKSFTISKTNIKQQFEECTR